MKQAESKAESESPKETAVPGLAAAAYIEPELTLEAKCAVRSYVTKLLAPIIAISGIMLFFLGYFVRDIAEKTAYTNAYTESQNYVRQLIGETATARSIATTASSEAATAKTDARASMEQAKQILVSVEVTRKRVEALAQNDTLRDAIADNLSKRDEFKNAIISKAAERLNVVEGRVTGLATRLDAAFPQRKEVALKTWHLAESDGFALLHVGGSGGADAEVYANPDKQDGDGPSRAKVSGYESRFIMVRKGDYYKAVKTGGEGNAILYWIPLFAAT